MLRFRSAFAFRRSPGMVCSAMAGCFLLAGITLARAQSDASPPKEPPRGALRLTSPDFEQGGMIPEKFTCLGSDISPKLRWTAPPMGAQSFALIVVDPDAPTTGAWVHWVIFNIPASWRKLLPARPQTGEIMGGARQGENSFGDLGYSGPCPPAGSRSHRYFFRLYALDTKLPLEPGSKKQEVLDAAQGHILAKAEVMARFKTN